MEPTESAAYDQLYASLTATTDAAARADLIIRMNDLLVGDVVVIPLVARKSVAGVSRSLAGVVGTPWDGDTWNIAEWRRSSR